MRPTSMPEHWLTGTGAVISSDGVNNEMKARQDFLGVAKTGLCNIQSEYLTYCALLACLSRANNVFEMEVSAGLQGRPEQICNQ